MPREMGYDYMGMSFQEKKGAAGRSAGGGLWVLLAVCLPDFGGFIRKLVASFQRPVEHADCGFRRLRDSLVTSHRSLGLPAEAIWCKSKATSIHRLVWSC